MSSGDVINLIVYEKGYPHPNDPIADAQNDQHRQIAIGYTDRDRVENDSE